MVPSEGFSCPWPSCSAPHRVAHIVCVQHGGDQSSNEARLRTTEVSEDAASAAEEEASGMVQGERQPAAAQVGPRARGEPGLSHPQRSSRGGI